jgi:hypothetical protein
MTQDRGNNLRFLPLLAAIALAMTGNLAQADAEGNAFYQGYHLDHRGDRIERRLDRKGDRVDRRLDRAALRASSAGHDGLARRLDHKGDRIDRRLDNRG